MSSVPSAPRTGASVQPDTPRVMAWAGPVGALAHLIPLTPQEARVFASQLTLAADAADQMTGQEGQR
ncbi:hypothetical protein ACWGKS_21930 [Nocardiopsis sp. NPDC055879]